mmetsp:Transcript_26179/g.53739  ORF Transcript_26179/g.53739 Transcript_26179/m.53739 type:complete len:437 (-) Transcript_26179:373-1683(-)
MQMNRNFGKLLAQFRHQQSGSPGSEQTSHVLDTETVSAEIDKLVGKIEVIIQVVLVFGTVIGNISSVGNSRLDESTGGCGGLDSELHVVDVVETVEHAENVISRFIGGFAELIHKVVGVDGVSNGIGTTEKHLLKHIGSGLIEFFQSFPWAFAQEVHADIKSGSAPYLERKDIGTVEGGVGGLGGLEQVVGPHSGGKERLMGVAHGSIGEHGVGVLSHCLGESLGALLTENLLEVIGFGVFFFENGLDRLGTRSRNILVAHSFGNRRVGTERLGMPVHSEISDVFQVSFEVVVLLSFGGAFDSSWRSGKIVQQLGIVLDEVEIESSFDEIRVVQDIEKERNIGFDTTNVIVPKSTPHPPDNSIPILVRRSVFHQKTIKVRLNDHTGVRISVDPQSGSDTVPADIQHSSGGSEVLGGIFGGDTTLHGDSAGNDLFLH